MCNQLGIEMSIILYLMQLALLLLLLLAILRFELGRRSTTGHTPSPFLLYFSGRISCSFFARAGLTLKSLLPMASCIARITGVLHYAQPATILVRNRFRETQRRLCETEMEADIAKE
jgi:hypothetical protein